MFIYYGAPTLQPLFHWKLHLTETPDFDSPSLSVSGSQNGLWIDTPPLSGICFEPRGMVLLIGSAETPQPPEEKADKFCPLPDDTEAVYLLPWKDASPAIPDDKRKAEFLNQASRLRSDSFRLAVAIWINPLMYWMWPCDSMEESMDILKKWRRTNHLTSFSPSYLYLLWASIWENSQWNQRLVRICKPEPEMVLCFDSDSEHGICTFYGLPAIPDRCYYDGWNYSSVRLEEGKSPSFVLKFHNASPDSPLEMELVIVYEFKLPGEFNIFKIEKQIRAVESDVICIEDDDINDPEYRRATPGWFFSDYLTVKNLGRRPITLNGDFGKLTLAAGGTDKVAITQNTLQGGFLW